MILACQVGLVSIACDTDHAARFTDVNVVVEAAEIIVAASSIQERATDTDHGGLGEKCGGRVGIYCQRLVKVR